MSANGPTAAKRPRLDARPATTATASASSPYTPSPLPNASSVSTPTRYTTAAANGASSIPIPTTTTPPSWTTAAQNPITLDPALASTSTASTSIAGPPTNTMPNPTSSFSRFLPQQQYPPGLPPTSPALSYPTAGGTHTPSTPTATSSYSTYSYQPQHSQYTSAGFVRTLPPSTTYAPYQQSPLPYTPAATSAPYLPAAPASAPAPPAPHPLDSSDPDALNDILGSAGVDVRAEQDAYTRSREFYQGQPANAAARADRTRKQAFIDTNLLAPTIRSIASNHNITKVSDDSLNYAALALRERLLGLINTSLKARNHRVSSTATQKPGMYSDGTTPMWNHIIRRDVSKQISAIEKVDREEEARIRRERHERLENPNGVASTSAAGGDSGAESSQGEKKRKRQKEMGPGVTAKTMSEEVRKKLVDDAASRAFGGSKKYAWMTSTPGAAASAAALPKPTATPTTATAMTGVNGTSNYPRPTAAAPGGGGWMRAQPQSLGRRGTDDDNGTRTLTALDVEFAVEREKGHGGGRGSARGW